MKLKFSLLILLWVHSFCLFSQTEDTENYSKKELASFAKVYQYTLDNPFDITTSMKKCVQALSISEKRMNIILQAQFAGKEIKLSSEEKMELERLKTMMAKDKEEYDAKTAKYMAAHKMQPSMYKKIEKAYHDNGNFQSKINKLSAKN